MRNLTPAAVPPTYKSRYEYIRNNKKDAKALAQLTKHVAYIDKRFLEHDDLWAKGQLHTLPVFNKTNVLKTALRSCYKSKTKGLSNILKAIEDAQAAGTKRFCYYCQVNSKAGWDHYLPSEQFPEFSVWASNLVPCCTSCNSTKGDDFLDATGGRQFIHFGHDIIPNQQFVFVALDTMPGASAPGAIFSIAQGTIPNSQWAVISNHFDRLNLIATYNNEANGVISDHLDICKAHLARNGDDAPGLLTELANRQSALFGRNHWRAVLLHAIAQHPDFANWV